MRFFNGGSMAIFSSKWRLSKSGVGVWKGLGEPVPRKGFAKLYLKWYCGVFARDHPRFLGPPSVFGPTLGFWDHSRFLGPPSVFGPTLGFWAHPRFLGPPSVFGTTLGFWASLFWTTPSL